jgi:K+-transporting ATPase ATPase A chain
MTTIFWLDFIFWVGAVVLLALPTGEYMAKVFQGESVFLSPFLKPIETMVYRLCKIDEHEEMSWKTYTWTFLWFNVISFLILFLSSFCKDISL